MILYMEWMPRRNRDQSVLSNNYIKILANSKPWKQLLSGDKYFNQLIDRSHEQFFFILTEVEFINVARWLELPQGNNKSSIWFNNLSSTIQYKDNFYSNNSQRFTRIYILYYDNKVSLTLGKENKTDLFRSTVQTCTY